MNQTSMVFANTFMVSLCNIFLSIVTVYIRV